MSPLINNFKKAITRWHQQDQEKQTLLILTFIVTAISLIWLKIIYPFPNFMPPDSNNYIEAAIRNDLINFWPPGYSQFLRVVHFITSSHFALVLLQYIILIIGILYLLFTIQQILSPTTWLFRIIFILSISNPLLPHIANFISSDCLFTALSLIWIAQLFWIIHQPTTKVLILHAVVILFLFSTRFAALYYPIISIGIILFNKTHKKNKFIGVAAISVLLLAYISITQQEYKTKTNTVQYSAFGGWQIAANALYAYSHVTASNSTTIPYKFQRLQTIVDLHMDSLRKLTNRPESEIGTYYLWDFKSPLRIYLNETQEDSINSFFYKWAKVAPLYNSYGKYVISKYPWAYIKHFAWPNFKRYYSPPTFFMGYYNLGNEKVDPVISSWFQWKSDRLPTKNKTRIIQVVNIFPILLSVIIPLFLLLGIMTILSKRFKSLDVRHKRILQVTIMIIIANAVFSILSAPIELRYELFTLIVMIPFSSLFLTWLIDAPQCNKQANSPFAPSIT